MLDKNITVNLPRKIKSIPMGKNNLIILEMDGNLTDKQYEHLREQVAIFSKDSKNCKVLILEGGLSIQAILTEK